jgi:oligoendopeptidase F
VTTLEAQTVDDGSDVFWDLDPLVDALGGMRAAIETAEAKAAAFSERYRGRVAELDAAGLLSLCDELAEVRDIVGRAGGWASLRFATDMTDAERGRDQQFANEKLAAVGNMLLFFQLEWAAVDDAAVETLLADASLAPYAHWLRSTRRYAPHLLSEPEERLMTEKAVTGRAAWSRLFNELTGSLEVSLGGQTVTLEQGLSQLQSHDPATRAEAAAAVTAALAPGLRTRAFVFNTLLADKATDDRLRSYSTWVSSMNLANEASDASVDALVASVQARYDLPQRWYKLKARLMGVERIHDWDRMAAVTDEDQAFGWSAAKDLVLDAYASFSPQLADAAQRFFDENWIDAGTRLGKRGGAFCSYTVPSHHPYVFLNWTSRQRDVLTLAHELGHGLHAYLAREQTIFSQTTGLTLAETASVFGETVTFGRLLEQTTDPSARLSLLASSIEGAIATVFRQTAMNRFEAAVHTTRRERGELSTDDFAAAWRATQSEMLGDAVELSEGYDSWWSYIPHFIGSPGYVYAYAYGQLLALSVYNQYEVQGSDFVPRYLHLLSAGGSQSPEDLAKIVGCDLADPGFWDGGLAIVEAQLDAAEDAAVAAGRL